MNEFVSRASSGKGERRSRRHMASSAASSLPPPSRYATAASDASAAATSVRLASCRPLYRFRTSASAETRSSEAAWAAKIAASSSSAASAAPPASAGADAPSAMQASAPTSPTAPPANAARALLVIASSATAAADEPTAPPPATVAPKVPRCASSSSRAATSPTPSKTGRTVPALPSAALALVRGASPAPARASPATCAAVLAAATCGQSRRGNARDPEVTETSVGQVRARGRKPGGIPIWVPWRERAQAHNLARVTARGPGKCPHRAHLLHGLRRPKDLIHTPLGGALLLPARRLPTKPRQRRRTQLSDRRSSRLAQSGPTPRLTPVTAVGRECLTREGGPLPTRDLNQLRCPRPDEPRPAEAERDGRRCEEPGGDGGEDALQGTLLPHRRTDGRRRRDNDVTGADESAQSCSAPGLNMGHLHPRGRRVVSAVARAGAHVSRRRGGVRRVRLPQRQP
eukprot:scaffold4944_cov135-Isochrysis_galbana.AAC.2